MQSWAQIVADVQLNWWLYLSMPFVAALIGYVTKIVAIKMMFQPIEFVGIKPIFGWQGIVPRKAATMASIACDTMTSRLIKPEDIFNKLDPDRIAREIEKHELKFSPVRSLVKVVVNQTRRHGEGRAVCLQLQQVVDRFVNPGLATPVRLLTKRSPTGTTGASAEMAAWNKLA